MQQTIVLLQGFYHWLFLFLTGAFLYQKTFGKQIKGDIGLDWLFSMQYDMNAWR